MDLVVALNALMIFALRILDVSLGTLRIGMLVRGQRTLAGVLSFFESLIWLLAAARVLTALESPIQFIAFAGGYAAGTTLGASIERWLAIGKLVMRVIAPVGSPQLQHALREAGFYVTVINAEGRDGDVRILFSVISRKHSHKALKVVQSVNPQAFVTLEEVTTAQLHDLSAKVGAARRFPRLIRR